MILVPIHKAAQSTSLPPYQQGIDGEDDTPQEWSLLELNGEIQTPRQSHDNDDAIELGSIEYDHEGTPTLIIASHELKGKVQPLKQPFVVINKKRDIMYSSSSNQQCGSSLKRADPNNCHDDDIHLDVPNKKRHCSKGRQQMEDGMVVCIDDNGDDSMEIESGPRVGGGVIEGTKEQGQEELHQWKFEGGYEIAGVVTSKILFDRYPKSIMK